MYASLMHIFLRVKLQDHKVCLCLDVVNTTIFPKWQSWEFQLFCFLFNTFHFRLLRGCGVESCCYFNFHFPEDKEDVDIFIHLLSIWLSSFEKYLFNFCLSFYWLLVSFLFFKMQNPTINQFSLLHNISLCNCYSWCLCYIYSLYYWKDICRIII